MPVAATFSFRDEESHSLSDVADVNTMVTVVDAANFLRDFDSTQNLQDRQMGADEEDERTIVDLLTDQIEFANVIVINKCDLVSEKRRSSWKASCTTSTRTRLQRVTRGKVDFRDVIGTGLYDEEAASRMPGWFKELNGEHIPETEEYGISSFVYRRRKPFHPQRLMDALNGGLLGVVGQGVLVGGQSSTLLRRLVASRRRSLQVDRGGLWFAAVQRENWPTDPAMLDYLETIWTEEVGDCRQELVFIGVEMDQGAIEAVP